MVNLVQPLFSPVCRLLKACWLACSSSFSRFYKGETRVNALIFPSAVNRPWLPGKRTREPARFLFVYCLLDGKFLAGPFWLVLTPKFLFIFSCVSCLDSNKHIAYSFCWVLASLWFSQSAILNAQVLTIDVFVSSFIIHADISGLKHSWLRIADFRLFLLLAF